MQETTTLRIVGSLRQTHEGALFTPVQWLVVELPTELDFEFYAEQSRALQ